MNISLIGVHIPGSPLLMIGERYGDNRFGAPVVLDVKISAELFLREYLHQGHVDRLFAPNLLDEESCKIHDRSQSHDSRASGGVEIIGEKNPSRHTKQSEEHAGRNDAAIRLEP